jgi:hypothetical protein
VTVLSACLGLLVTGAAAPLHAQPGAIRAANKSQVSIVSALSAQQLSPKHARKLALVYSPYFQIAACLTHIEPVSNLYQNSIAFKDKHQLLVVTRLPRAALSYLLAE